MSTHSSITIYDDLATTSYLERLFDNVNLFGAAVNGAINITNDHWAGLMKTESFWNTSMDLTDRDVDGTGARPQQSLSDDETNRVKYALKSPMMVQTVASLKDKGVTSETFSDQVGKTYADAVIKAYIKNSIAAVLATAGETTGANVIGSVSADKHKVFSKIKRLTGDSMDHLAAYMMNSTMFYDLIDGVDADAIYTEGGLSVFSAQVSTGQLPVIVTDAAGTAMDGKIIGLAQGGVNINESVTPTFWDDKDGTGENIQLRWSADSVMDLGIAGYSYKGATKPTAATLAASANWELKAQAAKLGGAFVLKAS